MSEAVEDLQAGPAPAAPLVLFDGGCNFCDAAVDFILARDRSGRFRFSNAIFFPWGGYLVHIEKSWWRLIFCFKILEFLNKKIEK